MSKSTTTRMPQRCRSNLGKGSTSGLAEGITQATRLKAQRLSHHIRPNPRRLPQANPVRTMKCLRPTPCRTTLRTSVPRTSRTNARSLSGNVEPVHIVARSSAATHLRSFRFFGLSLSGGGDDPLVPGLKDPVFPLLSGPVIKGRLVGEVAKTSTGLVGLHVAFADLDTSLVPDDDEIVVGFRVQVTNTNTGKSHWDNVPVVNLGEIHPGRPNETVYNAPGYEVFSLHSNEQITAVEGSFSLFQDHVPLINIDSSATVKLPRLSPSKG